MVDAASLVDWQPVARLALLGGVLALGPLAWVWLRHRGRAPGTRRRALVALTLFLTFDLVLFGAITRLTDSGLGCPDWPGCYGAASPIGASEQIAAAAQALPSGPVTPRKAWIEMIHRYLATAVGVLIAVIAGAAVLEARRERRYRAVALPLVTLVWVCVQGAFGALTVTMKLQPAIVTLHLLGGMGLLALLAWQAASTPASGSTSASASASASASPPVPATVRVLLAVVAAPLVLQIALGGWVSTNYAVLACSDFPRCQASWWPAMDFERGFTLWRALGRSADGAYLPFAALTAIHVAHRAAALVVLAALLALAFVLHRHVPAARASAFGLAALAALQVATGVSNVVLGWPIVAAVLHTGGAAALVIVLAMLAARLQGAKGAS